MYSLKETILKLIQTGDELKKKEISYEYGIYNSYSFIYGPMTIKWYNDVLSLTRHLPEDYPLKSEIKKVYDRQRKTGSFEKMYSILETLRDDKSLEMDHIFSSQSNDIYEAITTYLRAIIFQKPDNEKQVQNEIEKILIIKGLKKGIDYERESGKFTFSGREYIPDFIVPKLNLCIEVKLLREGKKSKTIEEINADITAYSKNYERLLFVVYDLGDIRDKAEFISDIENAGDNIKVLIIKQ